MTGELRRGVNCTNATIDTGFGVNITQALADTLGIEPADFAFLGIYVMWVSPDFILKGWETGFPTLWKLHIFRIEFELIMWNVNEWSPVYSAFESILEAESIERAVLSKHLLASMEMYVTELLPNALPMTYNETMIAPNFQDSAVPFQIPLTLLICVLLSGSL